jgi:hypothetical protein
MVRRLIFRLIAIFLMRRFREVKSIQQMTEFSSAAAPLALLDPPYVLKGPQS